VENHQLAAVTGSNHCRIGSADGSSGGSTAGWSLQLLGADIIASPSRFMQKQMVIARTDRSLLQLRQHMSSGQECGSSGGCDDLAPEEAARAAAAGQQAVEHLLEPHAPQAASNFAKQLPVFISDPEPAWLTHDIKQR
jgi:hypothetical protein